MLDWTNEDCTDRPPGFDGIIDRHQAKHFHIRWMIRRDLPEVLTLESVFNSRDPWLEEDFLHCLRQRNCIGMVVECGETVVGFMVYELHKQRLELTRIAVTIQGQEELFERLITKLMGKLSAHRRNRLCMTVDERDTHIHLALKANGLEAIRVEREWWTDDDGSLHDGYRFVRRLVCEEMPVQSYTEADCELELPVED
jgi:[ribosomal protein S18]-alanine N-acetyltransferase